MDSLKKLLGHHRMIDADADVDEEGNAPSIRRHGRLGDWEAVGWKAVKRSHRVIGGEFM